MKEETELLNVNYLVLLILSIFTAISSRFCAEQEMSKWVQWYAVSGESLLWE